MSMFPLHQRHFFQRRRKGKITKGNNKLKARYLCPFVECKRDCGACGDCEECDRIAYGAELSVSLKQLREAGELCDGSLSTEDGFEMKIHSFLICAVSPVIKTLLKNDGIGKVTLPNVSEEVLRVLVDFAYTSGADITENNVLAVLHSARKYGVHHLVGACVTFMKEHLTTRNCIQYMYAAMRYKMMCLEAEARRFMLWNWTKVWKSNDDFLVLLTAEDLSSLLEDDRLNVETEWEIHSAIGKWISHKYTERRSEYPSLLSKMRFDIVGNHSTSQVYATMARFYNGQLPVNFFRSRTPRKLIFAVGGWRRGVATRDIEVYDYKAGLWILSPHIDSMKRAYHGSAVLRGEMYLIGGYNGSECYRSVRSFDPMMCAWKERNSMNEARCYVSAVTLDDKLYAIGGFDGDQRKSSCERFDPTTNQWLMIASMNQTRSDASAAVHCGKIFVCGGYTGSMILFSAEAYDPESNQWTLIEPMPNPMSGHKLIEFQQNLYALGGFNGTNRLDKTYRYSQMQGQWIEDTPMTSPRSNFAAVEFENKLYVFGGFSGHSIISSMECYDADERLWIPQPSMNIPRSALGACVIEDIPNASRYSANGPYGKMMLPEYDRHLHFR